MNQEVLFLISLEGMSLLPQTVSSVTHLLSMMGVSWHNSLLAKILWYVMQMGSKVRNNSSNTLYDNIKSRGAMNTIITDGGNMKSQRKLWTFSGASSLSNMNQNHTINIKTKLNSAIML